MFRILNFRGKGQVVRGKRIAIHMTSFLHKFFFELSFFSKLLLLAPCPPITEQVQLAKVEYIIVYPYNIAKVHHFTAMVKRKSYLMVCFYLYLRVLSYNGGVMCYLNFSL